MSNLSNSLMDDFIDTVEIINSPQYSGRVLGGRPFLKSLQLEAYNDGEEMWRLFSNTCRILVSLGAYDRILSFVMGVFVEKGYDLQRMKQELERLKVGEGTLYDLCVCYIKDYVKEEPWGVFELNYGDIEEFDPFEEEGPLFTHYNPQSMLHIMERLILNKVYGYEIHGELTAELVDDCLEDIRKKKEAKEWVPIYTDSCLFNIAFIILRHAEVNNNKMLAWHVLDKWVLPIMKNLSWTDKFDRNLYVQLLFIRSLGSYYNSLIGSAFINIYKSDTNFFYYNEAGKSGLYFYSDNDFITESVGNFDGHFLRWAKSFNAEHPEMADNLKGIIERGYSAVSSVSRNNEMDFLILMGILLEYSAGNTTESSRLLLKYYNKLTTETRNRLVVQIVLIRCIIECDDYDLANKLFSLYSAESATYDEVGNYNAYLMREMVQFIRETKDWILKQEDLEFGTMKKWSDIIFENGRNEMIDGTCDAASTLLAKGEIIGEDLAKKVCYIVEALSNRKGVDYRKLGCGEYEDEYAYILLGNWMTRHGQALVDEFRNETKYYYESIKRKKNHGLISHSLKMSLHHREKSMLKDQIAEMNSVLESLRDSIDDDAKSDDSANEFEKALARQVDEYIIMLNDRLLRYSNSHGEKKEAVLASYSEFLSRYSEESRDIYHPFNQLDHQEEMDVTNYLVTSEIVFQFLETREYSDEVDYSPALIPLTKSLEVVMNHLFHSMEVQYDERYSNLYFNQSNNTVKQSIELGPAIKLLQSKQYINYDRRNRRLYFAGNRIGHSLFEDWNGRNAIDIRKLRRYSDISIKFNDRVRPDVYVERELSFGNDDNQNRMLLAKGIDYIRTNYRNIVAHKETVSQTKVTECKALLIQSEKLMWIIINALKK